MVKTVAGQGACAAERAEAGVLDDSGGGRGDVIGIEIDQVRVSGGAMGIVAGSAGCLLVHNMEPMSAFLPLAVECAETLIAQDTIAAVALIAKRIIRKALTDVIGRDQLPFQQRRVCRTVRPGRSRAAGTRALVVVVAIGAFDHRGNGVGREKTWNLGIFPNSDDRMIGAVGRAECHAHVRLQRNAVYGY